MRRLHRSVSDRKDADEQLKLEIGAKTAPQGISVTSVEIRDVAIPEALQNAMSRQPQAERGKQARVVLGPAEAAIAAEFVEAANIYAGHPWALQLHAMNIIYGTTKERCATILMPSSMVDGLNPSATSMAFALDGRIEPALAASAAQATTRQPVPSPASALVEKPGSGAIGARMKCCVIRSHATLVSAAFAEFTRPTSDIHASKWTA